MKRIYTRPYTYTLVFLLLIFLNSVLYAERAGIIPEESEIIGYSVEGRPIETVRLGNGERHVILIGGIHGGSEWNTIILVEDLLNYFRVNPSEIPENVTLHVVLNMNPDGLYRVIGDKDIRSVDFTRLQTGWGRLNGRFVDLNRNWDFNWHPVSSSPLGEVDAGSAPFSEPETAAVRDYIFQYILDSVMFYHCAADGIWYRGSDEDNAPAREVAEAYSAASGYRLPRPWGGGNITYRITGAASSYFYSVGIPSFTVELATAFDPEYQRNLAGVKAVLELIEKRS